MKLKELGTIVTGNTPSKQSVENWDSPDIGFVKPDIISDTGISIIDDAAEYISEKARAKARIVGENSILITCIGSIGKIGITAKGTFAFNQQINAIIPNRKVNSKYLAYALLYAKPRLVAIANAPVVPIINKSQFGDFEIKVTENTEYQSKAVEVLDTVNAIIENRRQQLQKLDELVKARFVELFGNPVINNKGWNVSDLGQLTIKIGSGATPKGGKEAYQTDGISLIRSMNVHNGKFEYKELAHISDEQAARLENVAVEKNDVLLNITGASVARSCVVPTNVLPARVNQHVCIIRCKDSIMPDFINSLLIDDNYQDLLWSIAGSGATREAITKQQVESLQIILPPISKQEEFSKFINRVDKSKAVEGLYSSLCL